MTSGIDQPANRVIDRGQVERARRRALRTGAGHFLHEHAADDLAERLGAVNRDFGLGVDMSIRPGGLERRVREGVASSAG